MAHSVIQLTRKVASFLVFLSFQRWRQQHGTQSRAIVIPTPGLPKRQLFALEAFMQIPELEPFFEQADGFAIFHNVAKGGIGIGEQEEAAKSFRMAG